MKRVLALVFLLLLLLTGCAGTPQSRESGATAVVSVLGVEPAGQGIHLLAAAEGRGEEEPFRCDSQGETPGRCRGGPDQPGRTGGELCPCGASASHPKRGGHPAGTAQLCLSGAPAEHGNPAVGGPGGYPGGGLFRGGGHRQADECHQVPGKKPPGVLPSDPPRGGGGLGPEGAPPFACLRGGRAGVGVCRLCPVSRGRHHTMAHRTRGPGCCASPGRPSPLDRFRGGARPWCCKAQAAGWSPRWRRDG